MFRAVIIFTLFAVALCHSKESEDSEESHEYAPEKHGNCPAVSSNVTALACATPCPVGTNCTSVNCSLDTNCTGAQKCCQTGCGLQCMDPVFNTVCDEDDDCPETLVCCKKSCVTVCVMEKPSRKYKWNHSEEKNED